MEQLTHIASDGSARMVDVSAKCVNRPSLTYFKASKLSWEARFPSTTFFKLAAIISSKVIGLSVLFAAVLVFLLLFFILYIMELAG